MDLLSVALALFFFMVTYVLYDNYMNSQSSELLDTNSTTLPKGYLAPDEIHPALAEGDTTTENIYVQSYYPWWSSARQWNYDGWLYQMPYYNYWRRPSYYNYWSSSAPLIIGGKRVYKRDYQ